MTNPKKTENQNEELSLDEMKKVVGGLEGSGSTGGDYDSNDACISTDSMFSHEGGDLSDVVVLIQPVAHGSEDNRSLLLKSSPEGVGIKSKNGTDDPEKIRPFRK